MILPEIDKKKPFQFTIGVGQVIKGWDEGVMKMSLGERAILTIPSVRVVLSSAKREKSGTPTLEYRYGERGYPGAIPGNADLVFDVELLQINNKRYYYTSDQKEKYVKMMETWMKKKLKITTTIKVFEQT